MNRFKSLLHKGAGICLALLLAVNPLVAAEVLTAAEVTELLQSDARSESDKVRDAGRKPARIVEFMGVAPGMTVLDLMAGSGYYTEVFSLTVGSEGRVYAQNPPWMLEFMKGVVDRAITERLADNRLANVTRLDGELNMVGIAPESVDAAFSALNFHDVYYDAGEAAALELLQQLHGQLKPGGAFLLIDHAGNDGQDNKALHRIPEDIVLRLAVEAGFTIEAEGAMLRNAEDDRSKMVFAKGLRGNTDRFALLLRK